MVSKLAVALELARRGFKVFPIMPEKKAPPLVNDWPHLASADATQIKEWWGPWPEANIGIHCEGLLVVDVDVRKGGLESWKALRDELKLPATLAHETPSGGFHAIYRLPVGHQGVPNSVEQLGKGLDVRSTGGYIVAPGSTTEQGFYSVAAGMDIAEAPAALYERLGRTQPKAPAKDVPDAPADAVAAAVRWLAGHPGAIEGQGGDLHTYATACRLRDLGLSATQALEAMADWNEQRCDPPWTLEELEKKVRNAYSYAQNEEGGRAAIATAAMFQTVGTSTQVPPVRTSTPIPSMAEVLARRAERRPYLVKGVLLQASHAQLFGAPGEGKTFIALDLAHAIATGREWHGRKVSQGPVVYVAYEGLGGLPDRLKALEQRYGIAADLRIADGGKYDLCAKEGHAALVADIRATCQPALVIIDTFARALAMSGADENSAKDVGVFNASVGGLIESFGASVMVVHHTGKDASKGARGSSALLGALDTELQVADFKVEATKQRDLQEGPVFAFKYAHVQVGMDVDGDLIESCTIEQKPMGTASNEVQFKGEQQVKAWKLYLRMSGERHEPVSRKDLVAQAKHDGISERTVGIVIAEAREAKVIREEGGLILKGSE